MDRAPPSPQRPPSATPRAVAVLACMSEQFFGPVLKSVGAQPVVLTRTLMAPEAYLLEALASSAARHGPTGAAAHRTALVDAYARYQRITPRAASSVFSKATQAQQAQVVAPPQLEPAPAVQPKQ